VDTHQKQYELTDYALETVHHKARQLVGKAGYTKDDLDDIKQDLLVDLLERLQRFDSAKATYNMFVACVVDRKISNMLRDHQAEKRDRRREDCSLNDEIDDGDEVPVQRLATMSQDKYDIRTGRSPWSAEEREHLRLDIETVLAGLPPDLRRAAELLQTLPTAQVAREMGVARATFYHKYLKRLRAVFAAKGMRDYLQ
jgi:RNA polymerase sigma-70 factor (ECF subfamily)